VELCLILIGTQFPVDKLIGWNSWVLESKPSQSKKSKSSVMQTTGLFFQKLKCKHAAHLLPCDFYMGDDCMESFLQSG